MQRRSLVRILGAMLFGYAALNTYLLFKINPLPISFLPRLGTDGEGDETQISRLAA